MGNPPDDSPKDLDPKIINFPVSNLKMVPGVLSKMTLMTLTVFQTALQHFCSFAYEISGFLLIFTLIVVKIAVF